MPEVFVLTGARLIVGDGTVIDDGAVLVRDGRIAAVGPAAAVTVPPDADRLDVAGKTIMPTIVNPHGHIGYMRHGVADRANYSRDNVIDHLRRLAYYGVSVFQSLGTDREDTELRLRDEQRAGRLSGDLALLLSASNGLVAPTPGESNGGPFFASDVLEEVATAEDARAAVRRIAAKRPDAIKIWIDDRMGLKRKLAPEVYAPLIDEAHAHGLKVIAHIYDLDDAKGVLRAGGDGLAHMVRSPGPDDELIELFLKNDAFQFTSMGIQRGLVFGSEWLDQGWVQETVPLTAQAALRGQMGMIPEPVAQAMRAEYAILERGLLRLHEAGVRILMSADTGLLSQYFGIAEHRELEAMAQAGMPTLDVLTSATLRPAEMLGLTDRGSLQVGKRADLLVLNGDPLENIANTRDIAAVYLGGSEVDRAGMRAEWALEADLPPSSAALPGWSGKAPGTAPRAGGGS